MNQTGLVGRMTRDPSLKVISENRVQTSFILAINRNYRNNQGEIDADFIPCIAWGRLAERIVKHCGKGSLVGVNGRLQSRSYTNKDNVKVYSTDVVVDDVRFFMLKSPGRQENSNSKEIANLEGFILPENEVPVHMS